MECLLSGDARGERRCCDDQQRHSAGSQIRSYRDSPICDVVVVVHGTEMILHCPDYSQAMRWARLERKSYKIPEPDIDVAANGEISLSGPVLHDLPTYVSYRHHLVSNKRSPQRRQAVGYAYLAKR